MRSCLELPRPILAMYGVDLELGTDPGEWWALAYSCSFNVPSARPNRVNSSVFLAKYRDFIAMPLGSFQVLKQRGVRQEALL
jgi:hypothetical protein